MNKHLSYKLFVSNLKTIYLFDFDGTLTSADTLLAFIRYARGAWRMLMGFMVYAPQLVMMKLGLYSNSRVKQKIFAWHFRGMKVDDLDDVCCRFAASEARLLRPRAVEKLRSVFADGHTVLVVSASVDNWVRPFFKSLVNGSRSDFRVVGTQVEADTDGRLTGRFRSPNCYGAEKVRRVLLELPDLGNHRSSYCVEAFGDSRGDREMLAFADKAHYKPFRK